MAKDERINKLVSFLEQQRDELKVKMHLAKADAKDEWQKVEKKWDELIVKVDNIQDEASESSKDIEVAAEKLADEIKKGYERIKNKI
ncbi:MAG: hypothetical protein HGB19_06905 [Chlorobiales bacterium]|jgi:hypothetical protein|nr:hypothetical protein [Chlorobiales bacterium]